MSSDPKGPKPTSSIYDLIQEHRPLYETGGHGPWSYCGCAIAKQIRVLNRFPALPYEVAHDKLASTIAELQREIEGYRQALEKYGTHRSGCTWWKAYSNKPECSCGFERVLARKEAHDGN